MEGQTSGLNTSAILAQMSLRKARAFAFLWCRSFTRPAATSECLDAITQNLEAVHPHYSTLKEQIGAAELRGMTAPHTPEYARTPNSEQSYFAKRMLNVKKRGRLIFGLGFHHQLFEV